MLEVWAHESFMDFNFNYTSLPFYLPTFLPSFPPSLTSSSLPPSLLPSSLPHFFLPPHSLLSSFLPSSLPPSSFLPSSHPLPPLIFSLVAHGWLTHPFSPYLLIPPPLIVTHRLPFSVTHSFTFFLLPFLPPSFPFLLPSLPSFLSSFLPSFFLSLPLCLLPSPSSPSFFALLLLLFPSFPFLPTSSFLPPLTNNSSSFSYLSPPDHPSDLSFLSLPPSLPGPLIPFSLTQQSSSVPSSARLPHLTHSSTPSLAL